MKKTNIYKKDGTILAALLSMPAAPRYLLIVCHGFLGAKENRGKIYPFAAKLNEKAIGVLAFDFTGSGESSGKFSSVTLSRQAEDLTTVIAYAEQEYQLPVILLGRSFGGSTIIALPRHSPSVTGYIFWSVPIDLQATFRKVLGSYYDQLEAGRAVTVAEQGWQFALEPDLTADFRRTDLKLALGRMTSKPVLICHGTSDEVVDFHNAIMMHNHLPQSALQLIEAADHRFTELTGLREEITLDWLEHTFLK